MVLGGGGGDVFVVKQEDVGNWELSAKKAAIKLEECTSFGQTPFDQDTKELSRSC